MSQLLGKNRAKVVIAVLALTVAASQAQNVTEPRAKCTVTGTVINAINQQPVKEAAVTLRALPGERSFSPAHTITGDGGRFSFIDLPPGRYLVSATHQGYVNDDRDGDGFRFQPVELSTDQHLDDLVIYLSPGGVISGQIFSAKGKPVSGVAVQALKRTYRFGNPVFDEVASALSNDSGEYRLTVLPAGDYYVRAVALTPQRFDSKSTEFYVPTYFPGTGDQNRSTLLVLRAGEQLAGNDLEMIRSRGAVISGRVIDAVTHSFAGGAELTLVEEGNLTPVPYSATADSEGKFVLSGVPRANYLLVAEKPGQSEKDRSMWGQIPVQVGDVDVRNVAVVISPGVDVSGHILAEDKAGVDLSRIAGILEPVQNSTMRAWMPTVENASVKTDGSFVFREVPAGTYRINFSPVPFGFYLKAAHTPDPLETNVIVTQGQPIQALQFVLSSSVARIEGTVMKDQQPVSRAAVVLVPMLERRSQQRFYRQTVSDRQGRFALQNIIPGDYEIFSWKEMERGGHMNPEVFRQLEGQGKAVTLKEGASLTLELDVISAE